MVPPQRNEPILSRAIHGHECGSASSPPTIRSASLSWAKRFKPRTESAGHFSPGGMLKLKSKFFSLF